MGARAEAAKFSFSNNTPDARRRHRKETSHPDRGPAKNPRSALRGFFVLFFKQLKADPPMAGSALTH